MKGFDLDHLNAVYTGDTVVTLNSAMFTQDCKLVDPQGDLYKVFMGVFTVDDFNSQQEWKIIIKPFFKLFDFFNCETFF